MPTSPSTPPAPSTTFSDWVRDVVGNTYIKNGYCPTLRQRSGVPMGGKCSGELASIYCSTIDLFSDGSDPLTVNAVQRITNDTPRFIDDLTGIPIRALGGVRLRHGARSNQHVPDLCPIPRHSHRPYHKDVLLPMNPKK